MPPIIEYGATIWGTNQYSCINAVQRWMCWYLRGVGCETPNAGVQGDMSWYFSAHHQWNVVTRHWCHLVNMEHTRLNKRVFT